MKNENNDKLKNWGDRFDRIDGYVRESPKHPKLEVYKPGESTDTVKPWRTRGR